MNMTTWFGKNKQKIQIGHSNLIPHYLSLVGNTPNLQNELNFWGIKKMQNFQHTMVIFQRTTTTSFWWTPSCLCY